MLCFVVRPPEHVWAVVLCVRGTNVDWRSRTATERALSPRPCSSAYRTHHDATLAVQSDLLQFLVRDGDRFVRCFGSSGYRAAVDVAADGFSPLESRHMFNAPLIPLGAKFPESPP